MRAVKIDVFQEGFGLLRAAPLAAEAADTGLGYLRDLFGSPALSGRAWPVTLRSWSATATRSRVNHQLAQDVLAVARG